MPGFSVGYMHARVRFGVSTEHLFFVATVMVSKLPCSSLYDGDHWPWFCFPKLNSVHLWLETTTNANGNSKKRSR